MIIFQIGIEHDRTTWSIYAGCSGCQSKQQSSKGPTKSRGWPLHFHSASCRSQLWEPGSRILSSNECHETLAPNHPQKHRRAMDPCKIYDFIWIHINNEINYIWNQPLEPVLMELLCFSGWGTLTTLTGSCGQHDRSDGSEHSWRDSKRSPRQCLPVRWAAPWTFHRLTENHWNIFKQFET